MRMTIAIAALIGAAAPAAAADPCAGVDTRLTPQRQQHFAPIVAQVAGGVAPAGVEITDYAAEGDWIFVYASFAELEPAFFFFRTGGSRMRYVDLWGGYTTEEERAEDTAWARGIGAPAGLAACFAERAING